MELRGYKARFEALEFGAPTTGVVRLELLRPVDPDALLNAPGLEERFKQDEYLPYWATLWPAALLLADEMARWPVTSQAAGPLDVLELGCGLGLVGLVATVRGYRVTVSDWDDDALAFVCASARHNQLPEPATLRLDWRQRYPALRPARILAADVLYERRNLQPVAEFVREHLGPQGGALIADANRSTADSFADVARACGLRVHTRAVERPGARGRIFELHRRG